MAELTHKFQVRLSDEDLESLRIVARAQGMQENLSGAVRAMIRRAAQEIRERELESLRYRARLAPSTLTKADRQRLIELESQPWLWEEGRQ